MRAQQPGESLIHYLGRKYRTSDTRAEHHDRPSEMLSDLQENTQQLRMELHSVTSQLQATENKLTDANTTIHSWMSSYRRLKGEHANLHQCHGALQRLKDETHGRALRAEGHIDKLTRTNMDLTNKHDQQHSQIAALQQSLRLGEARFANADVQLSSKEKQITALNSRVQALETELAQKSRHLHTLELECKGHLKEISEKSCQVEVERRKAREAEAKLVNAYEQHQQDVEAYKISIFTAQDSIKKQIEHTQQLRRQINNRSDEIVAGNATISRHRDRFLSMQVDRTRLEEAKEAISAQLRTVTEEKNDLQKRLGWLWGTLETERRTHKSIAKDYESEISQARDITYSLDQEISEAAVEAQTLRTSNEDLANQAEAASTKLMGTTSELAGIKRELEVVRTELEDQKHLHTAIAAKLLGDSDQALKTISGMTQRSAELSEHLSTSQADNERLLTKAETALEAQRISLALAVVVSAVVSLLLGKQEPEIDAL